MTDFTTIATGDRAAYDRRGTGPALIFVAGAGPFRAIDPVTIKTAELAAQQGVTTLVFDRLGRGEGQHSPLRVPSGEPLFMCHDLRG